MYKQEIRGYRIPRFIQLVYQWFANWIKLETGRKCFLEMLLTLNRQDVGMLNTLLGKEESCPASIVWLKLPRASHYLTMSWSSILMAFLFSRNKAVLPSSQVLEEISSGFKNTSTNSPGGLHLWVNLSICLSLWTENKRKLVAVRRLEEESQQHSSHSSRL